MSEDIVSRLARIETKLDSHLTTQHDHEKRIRSLEKSSWKLAGVAAAVTFLFSALWGIIKAQLKL